MKKRRLVLWLMTWGVTILVASMPVLATVGPPPNQCPGDCSPCLGDNDPFCDAGPGAPPPIRSVQCQTCLASNDGGVWRIGCAFVGTGEAGHLGCSTITDTKGNTKCTTSGSACTGVTTP